MRFLMWSSRRSEAVSLANASVPSLHHEPPSPFLPLYTQQGGCWGQTVMELEHAVLCHLAMVMGVPTPSFALPAAASASTDFALAKVRVLQ